MTPSAPTTNAPTEHRPPHRGTDITTQSAAGVEARRNKAQRETIIRALPIDEAAEHVLRDWLAALSSGRLKPSGPMATMLRTLHDIMRLERGQATSITEKVNRAELLDALAEMIPTLARTRRAMGEGTSSLTATTGDDEGVVVDVTTDGLAELDT